MVLVACVTQVSLAQTNDLTKKWAEAGELEKTVTKILLYAHYNDDAKKQIDAAIQDHPQYLTVEERTQHVEGWFNTIKGKLHKWDEKLSKGKNINPKDAIKAAICYASGYNNVCQVDYAKAEKYFQKVDLGEYNKEDIDMSIVGCKYMQNKDKSAALASMNFLKPSKDLSKIVEKYGIQDVYSEKKLQLVQGKEKEIKRAIRSKNMDLLLSLKEYDIREVDSTFAEAWDKECLDKCLRKYQIKRFIDRKLLQGESDGYGIAYFICEYYPNYPDTYFKELFRMRSGAGNQNKYLILEAFSGMCRPAIYSPNIGSSSIIRLLDTFGKKNAMAGYTMTAMVQIMGLNGRYKYPRDFRIELTKALANYIKNDPKLKTYGDFNKYFTIDDNGNITLVNIPQQEYDNDFRFYFPIPLYEDFVEAINNYK